MMIKEKRLFNFLVWYYENKEDLTFASSLYIDSIIEKYLCDEMIESIQNGYIYPTSGAYKYIHEIMKPEMLNQFMNELEEKAQPKLDVNRYLLKIAKNRTPA